MSVSNRYIDRVAFTIANHCDLSMSNLEERRLLRIYAVLALAKGTRTTPEDVHNAWAAWRVETSRTHPSIVPFEDLTQETQALDIPYQLAIIQVAVGMGHAG